MNSFNPATAHIDLPTEIIRRLNLNDLPLSRKQKLIAEIQERMVERLQNLLLAALSEEAVLQTVESVLAADADMSGEDLLRYIIRAVPDFAQRWEAECHSLFKNFI